MGQAALGQGTSVQVCRAKLYGTLGTRAQSTHAYMYFSGPPNHEIVPAVAVLPKNTLALVTSVPVSDDAVWFVEVGCVGTSLEDIFGVASENGLIHLHRSSSLTLQSAFGALRSCQWASEWTCSMSLDPRPDGIRSKQYHPNELGDPGRPSPCTTIDWHTQRVR